MALGELLRDGAGPVRPVMAVRHMRLVSLREKSEEFRCESSHVVFLRNRFGAPVTVPICYPYCHGPLQVTSPRCSIFRLRMLQAFPQPMHRSTRLVTAMAKLTDSTSNVYVSVMYIYMYRFLVFVPPPVPDEYFNGNAAKKIGNNT
jgi:hypothetical protein